MDHNAKDLLSGSHVRYNHAVLTPDDLIVALTEDYRFEGALVELIQDHPDCAMAEIASELAERLAGEYADDEADHDENRLRDTMGGSDEGL